MVSENANYPSENCFAPVFAPRQQLHVCVAVTVTTDPALPHSAYPTLQVRGRS